MGAGLAAGGLVEKKQPSQRHGLTDAQGSGRFSGLRQGACDGALSRIG